MELQNILNIESISRHFLIGLNFVIFTLIIPFLFFCYPDKNELIAHFSVMGIIFVSITVSYLFDILKVYRFVPWYRKGKEQFMKDIAILLNVEEKYASTYFSLISEMSENEKKYRLRKRHYDWILISTTSLSFACASFVYTVLMIISIATDNYDMKFYIALFMFLFSFLSCIRLYCISKNERAKSRNEYLLFISLNKNEIKKYMVLKKRKNQ